MTTQSLTKTCISSPALFCCIPTGAVAHRGCTMGILPLWVLLDFWVSDTGHSTVATGSSDILGSAEGLLLGQGQAMLVQLWVQVSQKDASFHSHLLLLLVHLQEPKTDLEKLGWLPVPAPCLVGSLGRLNVSCPSLCLT